MVGIWLGNRFDEQESRPEQAQHDMLATWGPVDDPAHTTNAEEELRRPCAALPLLRVN
jgi:hypothetical protein